MARVEPAYQSAPVRTAARAPERKMNPIFLGIVIGVLLGIGIALVVALLMNRNAVPIIERAKVTEQLPPAKPSRVDTPKGGETATESKLAAPAKASAEAKPRFEFYETLPETKNAKVAKSAPPPAAKAAPQEEAKKAPAKPADAPASRATPSDTAYALQAGAFQNQSDAESLKAKIAFAGIEATVRPVNLPDKGTLFRVRVGPYKNLDEVNRIKGILAANGVSASVVKPE